MDNNYLKIYVDRFELVQDGKNQVFYEGVPSENAKKRYDIITKRLSEGFLEEVYSNIESIIQDSALDESHKLVLKKLVDGITSEKGRAVVGVAILQLIVKTISPEQNIRLHKGSNKSSDFSWREGISMRVLDSKFLTPFLKRHGLFNMNKFGIMTTRSLAENYPYSKMYKAQMRGPVDDWMELVDLIEGGVIDCKGALAYILSLLKNRSDKFMERVEVALNLVKRTRLKDMEEAKDFMVRFVNQTTYSARSFEIIMHSLMQVLHEEGLLEGELVPLSQMRSANKKHGNVGDIELTYGESIIEAWDAKYGKPYLRDELEELNEKLRMHSSVEVAGFVVDGEVDLRDDILKRKEEIEELNNVEIKLLSFNDWVTYQCQKCGEEVIVAVPERWLTCMVETLGQKRNQYANIDEPCDEWIEDVIHMLGE